MKSAVIFPTSGDGSICMYCGNTLLRRQLVYINLELISCPLTKESKDFEHTAPESTVLGTATKIGSGSFASFNAFCVNTACGMPSRHIAKGQKFRVLTVSAWRSHGGLGVSATASTGNVFDKSASSVDPSCHTQSLLSLPWLGSLRVSRDNSAKSLQ